VKVFFAIISIIFATDALSSLNIEYKPASSEIRKECHLLSEKQVQSKFMFLFELFDGTVLSRLEKPLDLEVRVDDLLGTAQYSSSENVIRLPICFSKESERRSDDVMKGIYAHEYGHAYFHYNMMLKSKKYRFNYEIIQKFETIEAEISVLENKEVANLEELNKLKAQLAVLASSYAKAELDLLFIKGYNEFFADVVAVVYSHNLDIMWEATSSSKKFSAGRERSFSSFHKLDGWQGSSPYFLLSPTRSFLGKMRIHKLSTDHAAQFVSDLFDIIIEQIDITRNTLLDQFEEDPNKIIYLYDVYPVNINSRMIQRIMPLF